MVVMIGGLRAVALWMILFASTLAGCLQPGEELVDVDTEAERDPLAAEAVTAFDQLVLPTLDDIPSYGKETREWLKAYAKEYANRITFTPINANAAEAHKAELGALGYTVEERVYFSEASPVAPTGYKAIIASREGVVEPDRHIGLIAHYDARYTSNEAAYDDGSGVAAVMALARHYAEVDTRKSITILLFDAEELGLRAACYYAQDVANGNGPTYDLMVGYDMVGINWPGHEWAMYQMMGDEDDVGLLQPLAEYVHYDVLGFPSDGVTVIPEHDRNSDERRFREIGLPIYRMAGGRHAADYPHYHQPTDTYENMIAYAGGEENFEMGMDTVLQTSIGIITAADQLAFPDYELTPQPCSMYGPDDGPL